jgi:UDP-N-acetylmuramyl pentapeptide phosphotransferase/UDP-N-acetylglucosamine-1-phosphate transferase
MAMILYQVVDSKELMVDSQWWELMAYGVIALIVTVGATNIYNFMDGINGITGGYSLAVLIPLIIKNEELAMKNGEGFVEPSLLIVVGLSLLVFCLFNFRKKAKCFAGDVGSIGIALILLFCIGRLIVMTGDVTWLVFFLIYGVDGVLTICHRIMLHENLGEAHRKHAYQLMANELKIPHVVVSAIYMALQLAVSLIAIYVIPDTVVAHWIYLVSSAVVMGVAYVLFKMKYYHLHEEYLLKLKDEKGKIKDCKS